MKRRIFIRQTAATIAGTGIFSGIIQSCTKNSEVGQQHANEISEAGTQKSVLIIGAGAAGLVAASFLKANGINVTILEAAETYGGRIKKLESFADFPIEVGAEYIHGKNTSWYKWNVEYGAQFVNYTPKDFYSLDGILKSEKQVSNDVDVKKAWAFEKSIDKFSGSDKSFLDHEIEQQIPERVRHIVNADFGNDWGTSDEFLSVAGVAEEDNAWTAGLNDYLVKNYNYIDLLNHKCSNILPFIKTNSKVVSINYEAALLKVTDNSGNHYKADKILITVPLSILQKQIIDFAPTLPQWKIDAINNIRMGNGMKIILSFKKRFWDKNLRYIYGDLVPIYWYTSIQKGNSHVITAFVMGNAATYLSSLGSNATNTVLQELDSYYTNAATPNFLAAHIEDWTLNPNILGSYSSPIVNGGGLQTRFNLYKNINNKIFFAGEAAHFKGHNSTVHGAVETGLWASADIINNW